MRSTYLLIWVAIVSLLMYGCEFEQNDTILQAELDSVDHSTIKEEVIINVNSIDSIDKSETILFNPYYKPFYGGLTMAKLYKLYNNDNTASGPGNPFKIKCYPNYKDSATGTYNYYGKAEMHCNVNVSIWQKGFYNNDSTQRINSAFITNENCKFNELLPIKVGQKFVQNKDSLIFVDTNIFLYIENDYEFIIFIHKRRVRTMYIERFYCINKSILEKDLSWFIKASEQAIDSQNRRNEFR